nr:hypothetical protein [uncultured Flavobacterium sp.]
MKIGNWEIDVENEEIIWKGKGKSKIVLAKDNFFGLTLDKFMDELFYLCEKELVNDSDVFALNSALMYAFEEFNINKPEGFSFSTLIKKQIIIISDKNNSVDEI